MNRSAKRLRQSGREKSLPDFSKKLISIHLAGDDDGRAISRPYWKIQGGKLFLVGTVPRGGSVRDWCEGLVSAVAWDQVTDYLIFDSEDDYRQRVRRFEKRKT